MTRSVFENIRISGVAAAVPRTRVVNATAHSFVSDEDRQKVIALTGVNEYRKADGDTCSSDLCEAAAKKLLAELDTDAADIDGVIFVSMTPDYPIPSTACLLQDRLGCNTSVVAFDINMGCSGYVVGLHTVCALMQGAGLRKVLLLTGDTQTKIVYPQDKNVAFILADGGTATLLEHVDGAPPITIEIRTDGGRFKNLYIPAGGFRTPSTASSREVSMRPDGGIRADDHLFMNGMEIFKFSSTDVVDSLETFMADNDAAPDKVRHLFLHQANKFMLDKIAAKLKFPLAQVPYSIQKYGNTGSASIPVTIAHHFSTADEATPGRSLLCGFGVGLSWGIVDVDLSDVRVPEIVEVGLDTSASEHTASDAAVLVFPGQGSQFVGMGRWLFDRDIETRVLFAEASEILDIDVERLCFEGPESDLAESKNVQPAVTLVNIAMYEALRRAGVEAVAVGGHSLGEYSALYAAGVLSLLDTLTLVRERGRLMQEAAGRNPGGMLAIMGLSIQQVTDICASVAEDRDVQVANHNSDTQVIVTGQLDALGRVESAATKAGALGVTPLRVSGPWHSRYMADAAEGMRVAIERADLQEPRIPVVSNVSGEIYQNAAEIRAGLVEQICSPVRWMSCAQELVRAGPGKPFIEVGPGSTLTRLMGAIDSDVSSASFDQAEGIIVEAMA